MWDSCGTPSGGRRRSAGAPGATRVERLDKDRHSCERLNGHHYNLYVDHWPNCTATCSVTMLIVEKTLVVFVVVDETTGTS